MDVDVDVGCGGCGGWMLMLIRSDCYFFFGSTVDVDVVGVVGSVVEHGAFGSKSRLCLSLNSKIKQRMKLLSAVVRGDELEKLRPWRF